MKISFEYMNYKGERSEREVEFESIEFIHSPGFGYQPGWFVSGITEKGRRSFALSHIILPENSARSIEVLFRLERTAK